MSILKQVRGENQVMEIYGRSHYLFTQIIPLSMRIYIVGFSSKMSCCDGFRKVNKSHVQTYSIGQLKCSTPQIYSKNEYYKTYNATIKIFEDVKVRQIVGFNVELCGVFNLLVSLLDIIYLKTYLVLSRTFSNQSLFIALFFPGAHSWRFICYFGITFLKNVTPVLE